MVLTFYNTASSKNDSRSNTFAAKTLNEYNKAIRNEYVVSLTNIQPEYYQKHQQHVPNPCK